jgi:hypothetical protein
VKKILTSHTVRERCSPQERGGNATTIRAIGNTGLVKAKQILISFPPHLRHVACTIFFLIACSFIINYALNSSFVNYDDPLYVTSNPHVISGLTWSSIKWAVTDVTYFYHPVTWLSLMLDASISKVDAEWFHAVNALIHIYNSTLVCLLLSRIGISRIGSYAISVLFLVHPASTEVVFWISERKSLLATLFGLLSLISYVKYLKSQQLSQYAISLFMFLLGSLSKPSILGIPLILILLDWLLHSSAKFSSKHLAIALYSKLPFFAVASTLAILTTIAEIRGGALNAAISYQHWSILKPFLINGYYLKSFFCPVSLTTSLPPIMATLGSNQWLILISGLTMVWCIIQRRNKLLMVGMLWFYCTMIPHLGFIRIGSHDVANRYLYFSGIGLFLVAYSVLRNTRVQIQSVTWAVTAGVMLIHFRESARNWTDSDTLWRSALQKNPESALAWNNLAVHAVRTDTASAELYWKRAITCNPAWVEPKINMIKLYHASGDHKRAIFWAEEAYRDLLRENALETVSYSEKVRIELHQLFKRIEFKIDI